VFELARSVGVSRDLLREAVVLALDAALDVDDVQRAEELVREFSPNPAELSSYHIAALVRAQARLASRAGRHEDAEPGFVEATDRFRALGYPFWVAVCSADHAAFLAERGRNAEAMPLAEDARGAFESLGARPWLGRVSAISTGKPVTPPASPN
jgi:hypothetical protein